MNTKLVLIPCSQSKVKGGAFNYSSSEFLSKYLSLQSFDRLMATRRELSRLLHLPPGPDLGFSEDSTGIAYTPAYRRYAGRIYETSQIQVLYPSINNTHLVIISALYGLLNAKDLIRYYDVFMGSKLSSGTCLYTWWKKHDLSKILCEYVQNIGCMEVHDLLTADYHKAVIPWPYCIPESQVKSYKFPGIGQGSNFRRGKILEKLLLSDP